MHAERFDSFKAIFFVYKHQYKDQHAEYLHRYIKEDRQKKFIVNGHRYELAFVEFGRSFSYHDAESNTPNKK